MKPISERHIHEVGKFRCFFRTRKHFCLCLTDRFVFVHDKSQNIHRFCDLSRALLTYSAILRLSLFEVKPYVITTNLPIGTVLADLAKALEGNTQCILEAPPGAGKTTIVPLALLNEPWLEGRKIIMLEPRRIAAKAAARRLQEGLRVGLQEGFQEVHVGYRIRGESTVRKETRIEVVTEGVLTKMLSSDSALSEYGLVIFDEFHERSIHADVGLGLTLLTQDLARADLRILVMSATLASLDLPRLIPDAAIVRSEGRMFPVETIYLRSKPDRPLQELVRAAVADAIRDHDGDVLVFLPGQGEIKRCLETLEKQWRDEPDVEVLTLYGDLSPEQQDRVLRPSVRGQARRVILSTSVAETSVTIDGVRTVIDAGLSREPRFDPRSGMTQLVTVPVSKDAAEQRRGRAGRTQSGWCIRLWTEQDQTSLPERR
ncbi:MAG: DEAD/DEAH box helicase, partial [Ignavibacteriae bacterium]